MVEIVPRPAYRDQLHALLPSGPAWSPEAGTVLDLLLDALASQMAGVDSAGVNLLDEIRPPTTVDLLPDWERVVGLPDICSVLGSTITVRRASLLEKLVTKPTLNASEFVRIGRTFGVEIVVEEHDQTRADAIMGLDTTNGKWRFVWWISIPTSADVVRLTTLSTVKTPFRSVGRNTEMECRLQNAAPAHTHLVIGYFSELQFELPAHTQPNNNQIRWQDTANGLGDVALFRSSGDDETQIVRFQINGNAADSMNRPFFGVDDGSPPYSAFGTGPQLSDEFETSSRALVVRVPGLNDLMLAGPDHPSVADDDPAEPYTWIPGDDYTNGAVTYTDTNGDAAGLAQWVTDFKAAYSADNGLRATVVVSDRP